MHCWLKSYGNFSEVDGVFLLEELHWKGSALQAAQQACFKPCYNLLILTSDIIFYVYDGWPQQLIFFPNSYSLFCCKRNSLESLLQYYLRFGSYLVYLCINSRNSFLKSTSLLVRISSIIVKNSKSNTYQQISIKFCRA